MVKKALNSKVYEVLAMMEGPIDPSMNLYDFADIVIIEMAQTDDKWLDFPHKARNRFNKVYSHIYKYTHQQISYRLKTTLAKVEKIR